MDNLKEQFETMMNSFREIYGDSFKFKGKFTSYNMISFSYCWKSCQDGPGTLNLKKLIVCLQLSIGDVDNIENITTVMKLELCQLSGNHNSVVWIFHYKSRLVIAFHKLVSLVEFSRFDPKSFTQQERYLLFEMGIEFQKLERGEYWDYFQTKCVVDFKNPLYCKAYFN